MKTLILAAGIGKRMKSKYPKVVHKLSGKPILSWVIDTAKEVSKDIGIVLGCRSDEVKKILPSWVKVFYQKEPLGTAHAVMCAKDFIDEDEDILILYGDVPLIKKETIQKMLEKHRSSNSDAIVLTAIFDDPRGYGRIVRKNGKITIIEDADADDEIRKIKEINTGIYIFKGRALLEVLPRIKNENAQGEYYLTDGVRMLQNVETVVTENVYEVIGVNTRKDLIKLEEYLRWEKIEELLESGVTILDPNTTFIQYTVKIGKDTIIYPFTLIEGHTEIGEDCEIGPMTRLIDCEIGDRVRIVRSECTGAFMESDVTVGPFARLREGTVLKRHAKIGNFVEVKKSTVGENSKAQHLTYIGDTFIGKDVNVGAGTITCNYDGKRKNPTFIEDGAFIGSNTALVAPVRVGKRALVGAGSVITEDVPPYSLALGRARQVNKEGWVLKKYLGGEE